MCPGHDLKKHSSHDLAQLVIFLRFVKKRQQRVVK
jgi:hypothetical protein